MPKPIGRVLTLLELLQAGGTRTVGELAGRLGVDERTVRRYAAQLDELGIPVQSVRGRYGGYRLLPGYRLPPLMLTDDEALATLVGLASGGVGVAGETAAAKIRRVLPTALAHRLDALLRTADLGGHHDSAPTLLLFANAALHRRPVRLRYQSRDGRDSERVVRPYGLVARGGHWYVVGADSDSGEVRTFRVDRVRHATEQDGAFDVPADVDPAAMVRDAVTAPAGSRLVVVRVRGTVADVAARVPGDVVRVTPSDDGWVRLRLHAQRLDWVPSLLAWLDCPFVIEQPDELREEVRALATRLVGSADGAYQSS